MWYVNIHCRNLGYTSVNMLRKRKTSDNHRAWLKIIRLGPVSTGSLPHMWHLKPFLFIYFICFPGSRAGGCLPLYSNSGCRGPDWQEGPAHQRTRPLRRSIYQGKFVCLKRALTSVRLWLTCTIRSTNTKINLHHDVHKASRFMDQAQRMFFFYGGKQEMSSVQRIYERPSSSIWGGGISDLNECRAAFIFCQWCLFIYMCVCVCVSDCPSWEPRCYWENGYYYRNTRISV